MAWGMVVGAGVSIIGGALTGKGSKGREAEARARELEMQEREIALGEDQFAWNKDIYNQNRKRYDPIFGEMREMMDDNEPDYGAIAGDINKSFDSARGMEERNQRRYGIKPTDGAAAQSQRDYGIRRGTAHVGARSAARRGAKDQRYARRADLFNTGQGIQSNNQGAVNAAAANAGNAYGNAANQAGNRAGQERQNAQESAAGWGQAVGSIPWGNLFKG